MSFPQINNKVADLSTASFPPFHYKKTLTAAAEAHLLSHLASIVPPFLYSYAIVSYIE